MPLRRICYCILLLGLMQGAACQYHGQGAEMPSMIDVIKQNKEGAIEKILEKPDGCNRRDADDNTPLHWACYCELPLSIIQKLVENGADVNALDQDGDSPLYWAIQKKTDKVASFLIEKGTVINKKNRSGQTALHCAVKAKAYECIQLLLRKEGNVHILDDKSKKPMDYAEGDQKIIDILGIRSFDSSIDSKSFETNGVKINRPPSREQK